jgi:hypothetical protein
MNIVCGGGLGRGHSPVPRALPWAILYRPFRPERKIFFIGKILGVIGT